MAGTIVADTLTHSTAGSIATNYVVDGSAKAWVNFDGTGTPSIRNSLNTSSLTDVGTGIFTPLWSTSFSAGDYSAVVSKRNAVTNSGFAVQVPTINTGYCEIQTYENSTATDTSIICCSTHGDLA